MSGLVGNPEDRFSHIEAQFYSFTASTNVLGAETLVAQNVGKKEIKVNQEEKIKQLDHELEEEKAKRMTLEAIVESVRDKCNVLDSHGDILNSQQMEMKEMREISNGIVNDNEELEKRIHNIESSLNETTDIRSSLNDFKTSLRTAFRAEKHFVRDLTRGFKKAFHQEIEEMKNDSNAAISEMRNDISGLLSNASAIRGDADALEELDNRLSSLVTTVNTMNSDVVKVHTKLDVQERDLSEIFKCCIGKNMIQSGK